MMRDSHAKVDNANATVGVIVVVEDDLGFVKQVKEGGRMCERERERKAYLRTMLWWRSSMASGTEWMMVTVSCSVNENKVKELFASGELKEGIVFCTRLKTLRDRQC